MLLRRTTATAAAAALFHRTTAEISLLFFSTAAASNPPKPFAKIPWKFRSQAIQESQKALLDYLHTTRSVPFLYAHYISKNSPQCLSQIVSEIPFSPSNFLGSFQRFLRYHPINELEFLFESIGLNFDESYILPKNTFYISDWERFDVVCALAGAGFPWGKLGLLFRENFPVFKVPSSDLMRRIGELKDSYGFDGVSIISICLAFPQVLYSNADSNADGLLSDLKTLFLDYDLLSCVKANVDSLLDICDKIKLFYDLGFEMGKVGELMGRSKCIFVEYPKERLRSKIEWFCRLNVGRDEVGVLLLSRPDLLALDPGDQVISVSRFLAHFGMGEGELKSLEEKYPHVFGRNRLANIPHSMRALGLGKWFFDRIQTGDPLLLASCAELCTENLNEQYEESLRKSLVKRTRAHIKRKLDFIHGIGFGENKFAIKALTKMHGNSNELQERFDFLLGCGVEYSKLCLIVKFVPMVLNQCTSRLEKKIEFFCTEMGLSLQHLDNFPGYLCYDLEKRIKPRYRFHKWLKEQGYCKKDYALSTVFASSNKTFVAQVACMNHAAAKMWQENSLK